MLATLTHHWALDDNCCSPSTFPGIVYCISVRCRLRVNTQSLAVTLAVTTKLNGPSAGTLLELCQARSPSKHMHSFPEAQDD